MPYKLWFKDSGKESSKDSGESSTALGIEEPERLYVCMHVFCLVQIPRSDVSIQWSLGLTSISYSF